MKKENEFNPTWEQEMRIYLARNAGVLTDKLMQEVTEKYLNCNYIRQLVWKECERFLNEDTDNIVIVREEDGTQDI